MTNQFFSPDSRFLVVDDYETIRTFLRKALADLGYLNVEESHNGRSALEALKKAQQAGQPFDLVFLDWSMPEMTGIEMLSELRRTPELASTNVVMVTAESERKAIIEAAKFGIIDYIVKPFPANSVRDKMKVIEGRLVELQSKKQKN